jgi:hypothetical protein
MSRNSLSVEIAGRKISGTFYNWFVSEVTSSGIDNTFLDDYTGLRDHLGTDYESDDNWSALKQRGHLDRMDKKLWPLFESDPQNDEFSAQVLFGAMMLTSGAYRLQSNLQSKTAEEYLSRRKRAIGINLQRTVTDHLATVLPASGNFSHANISVDSYNSPSLEQSKEDVIHKIGEASIKFVVQRVNQEQDLGVENSPSVNVLLEAQKGWVEFATDCVTVAAKLRRGELSAVPFLEPKSISAKPPPKLFYPLSPDFTGF